jgi:hypothetical protein
MATKFELRLIVPAKLVGTIVELVEGEGILVEMKPHHDNHKRKHNPYPRHHVTGMTADQLMSQFLSNLKSKEQFTTRAVENVFKEAGYAKGTVSSRLSTAKARKLIKGIGSRLSGMYEKA